MSSILFASYDMEVGGVERSLASMLKHFDYRRHSVDLMLYRHQGEFMDLLPRQVNVLREQPSYSTFRKSISETLKEKQLLIGASRIVSKLHADISGRLKRMEEGGYYQMQLMWRYALPFLPEAPREYDAAVSFLWPHYYVAEKVKARTKIAWIHTDYSTVETDRSMDLAMWRKFDHIIAVSDACKEAFLTKYAELRDRITVIENITSPAFIRAMAEKRIHNPMLADGRFKLITVARLSHAKGIDNAVRALSLLKSKGYENFAWYVVGYGGDEPMIRGLIAEYGLEEQFILLGKQTNPYPFIRAADLYVQPSRYEGKAVTVTEAKVLGKAVLITNYSTARSQLTDGVDGMIGDLSVEGIAAGIEKLYLDRALKQRLADQCRATDYGNSDELDKLYRLIEGSRERSAAG